MSTLIFLIIAGVVSLIIGFKSSSSLFIIVGVCLLAPLVAAIIKLIADRRKKQREEALQQWRLKEQQHKREMEELGEAERRAKEAALRAAEAKANAARAAELRAKKDAAFLAEIDEIPAAEITLASEKYPKRTLRDMPEIKFTNITKRTNPLSLSEFVVVDVETTGIPANSKIIELSAVRFEDWQPVEKFSTLIDPERPIPTEATSVNHITDDMVKGMPKIWEVMPAFQSFVGESSVVGHNLSFDLKFLHVYGFDFDSSKRRYYDTLTLAKSTLKRAKYHSGGYGYDDDDYSDNYDVLDYKLETLCNYYRIHYSNAHRACSDCLVTGKLLKELAENKME